MLEKAIKSIKSRYGVFLSQYERTPKLTYKFCLQGSQPIVLGVATKQIPIKFVNSETGYTDGSTIYFPKLWLHPDFYTDALKYQLDKDQLAYAIVGSYNGLLVHESLHVLLTKKLFDVKYIKKEVERLNTEFGYELKYNQVFKQILNAVEDVYIEQYAKRHMKNYYFFVKFLNAIIFSDNYAEHILNMDDDVYKLTHVVTLFKNRHEELKEELPEIWEILKNVFSDCDEDTRIETAYRLLMLYVESSEDQNEALEEVNEDSEISDSDSATEGNDVVDSEGNTITDEEIDAINKKFDEIDKDLDNKTLAQAIEKESRELYVSDSEEKAAKRYKEAIHTYLAEGDKQFNVKIGELPNSEINNRNLEINERVVRYFEKVADEFKKAKSRVNNPTPPQKKGRLKNSLVPKIAVTDSVMRVRNHKTYEYNKPEVVILSDISGSTLTKFSGDMLIEYIINGMLGLYRAFVKNDIPVSGYTHTTSGYSNCLITPVLGYKMPLNGKYVTIDNQDAISRSQRVFSIDNGGNADAVAISYLVRNAFTKENNQKVLIVISDGEPSQADTSFLPRGYHLKEQLRDIVAEIRRKPNNHVYSISVQSNVVEANNHIYGKKYNIDASSGNYEEYFPMLDIVLE